MYSGSNELWENLTTQVFFPQKLVKVLKLTTKIIYGCHKKL